MADKIKMPNSVKKISLMQIKIKKRMRKITPLFNDLQTLLDEAGDCDVVRSCGIQHVHLGWARAMLAENHAMFEQSYAGQCDLHNGLTKQAEDANMELVEVKNGDGGR